MKTGKPLEIPTPKNQPEIIPHIDPEEPTIPEENPYVEPDENPYEIPPYEIPPPGEGPNIN